jgi:hypothetical protein
LPPKTRESIRPDSDIQTLPRDALIALWTWLYEKPPPARLSRTFQRRFLAFELQARMSDPLPACAKTQSVKLTVDKTCTTKPVLKSGGRYLRK